ncbi:glutathione peroxidase [Aneurinibacillus tyrosinisolvens]|uniref:glutathione peroxidase n=1 Tax=Aneurinibacillus tyrosinisolvens TaxID=1443435 RepID=UPI00063F47E9|nr:glutathione peroxidase [Aneurinibacillus tyrosinisolvens]
MTVYNYTARTISGEEKPLSDYAGKALLIVNTASKCGFTPQYSGLQQLYEKYKEQGFEILAFPSNQFLNQEPGTNEEIQNFCQTAYGVMFPVFEKIDVNGADAHPLFAYLTESTPGLLGTKAVKWNFTKFLVNKQGIPVKRYAPAVKPEELDAEIIRLLEEGKEG